MSDRVRRDGKFFRLGDDKFYVKGVTYGPFAQESRGTVPPERPQVRRDFQQITDMGGNCLRVYHIPPRWFLDLAQEMGLKVFLDVSWPKNLTFCGDAKVTEQAQTAVRNAARECGNHPAIFAISVVNEIPPGHRAILRPHGDRKVRRCSDRCRQSRSPNCLFTFANFPTTEYLHPSKIDFVCFNVYLHDEQVFRNYLARLQNIAGDLPLLLGEYGIDTFREYSEPRQAEILAAQTRAIFDEGASVYSSSASPTTGSRTGTRLKTGHLAWFVVTARPSHLTMPSKDLPAPQVADVKLPKVSVIVCSYNGASTVESCLTRWSGFAIRTSKWSSSTTEAPTTRRKSSRNSPGCGTSARRIWG